MANRKSGSILSMLVISLLASAFVAFIAWGSFNDTGRILIAGLITFVVVFIALLILKWVQRDDDVQPGVPRLK